jgi:hypothetical protein
MSRHADLSWGPPHKGTHQSEGLSNGLKPAMTICWLSFNKPRRRRRLWQTGLKFLAFEYRSDRAFELFRQLIANFLAARLIEIGRATIRNWIPEMTQIEGHSGRPWLAPDRRHTILRKIDRAAVFVPDFHIHR